MKILHLEAQKKHVQDIDPRLFKILPEKIGLLYTVQYRALFEKIKKELEKQKKKVIIGKALLDGGQITGCNTESATAVEDKIDCFVLVSSGFFHAISLALSVSKPIYIIREGRIEQFEKEEIEQLRKKRKAAVSKFLLADKIGIIVSTKHGQNNLKKAIEIQKKIKKESFIFIAETINLKEMENFKIDSWINTACPGLAYDYPNILNLNEYANIEKFK
jgi:2-(3-amino-3-carboxypropyl)histidine synthase